MGAWRDAPPRRRLLRAPLTHPTNYLVQNGQVKAVDIVLQQIRPASCLMVDRAESGRRLSRAGRTRHGACYDFRPPDPGGTRFGDCRRTIVKALKISNLRKVYGNGVQALRGLDLEVDEGDFFALLGPNGAGKTTAIGIITSLVNKTAGDVEVFGHNIDREIEIAKSCIGLVPQEVNFNQFEKVHNVVLNQAGYYGIPRRLAHERAEKYLRELSLWEKRNETSRSLSGGMKRRLMIARALVHEPRLLILDEPTAGVDIEIRRSMWEFMQNINRAGTTIILTTHYLEEAENLCRHIGIIDDGRIIERGLMRDVLRKLGLETFVLSLREHISVEPDLGGYPVRRVDETNIEVDVLKEQSLNEVFARLTEQNLHVQSMRSKTNRLEELFLRLVENKNNRSGA